MTSPFGCFLCNGADHWQSNCPELLPPADKAEYEERFDKYKRWGTEEFRISPRQKQDLIKNLNAQWAKVKSREKAK